MRKFYKVGFYVMLGIFVAMFFISAGPVGRWPFVPTQKITFQYGQYIDDIDTDSLAIRSPATFVVVMDSLHVSYITNDVTTDKITVEDSIVADEIYVQGIFHLASGYMSGDTAWLTDGSIVSSPAAGMILMDTVKDTMIVYDGSAWKVLW